MVTFFIYVQFVFNRVDKYNIKIFIKSLVIFTLVSDETEQIAQDSEAVPVQPRFECNIKYVLQYRR